MKKNPVLYIDDDFNSLKTFKLIYRDKYNIYTATSGKEGFELMKKYSIKVAVVDQLMPEENGIDCIIRFSKIFPDVIFVILTGLADFKTVQEAMMYSCISRYVVKPWDKNEMENILDDAIEKYNLQRTNRILIKYLRRQNNQLIELKRTLENENRYLKEEIKLNKNFSNIVYQDKNFKKILKQAEEIAKSDATVLISGETGTGKELIATAIHNCSSRSNMPFVKINCSAFPETLIESELFGYEKGAFTGAITTKKGKFEIADKGTIFLDEIGELPIHIQPKLLRVIQEREVERIGGNKIIKLDIRIIAATNKVLENEIKQHKFRQDLYYRLNVCPLNIPPLRERINDLEELIKYFLNKFNIKYRKSIRFDAIVHLEKMKNYSWPGNIRELENVIERAVITSNNKILEINDSLLNNNTASYSGLSLKDNERRHILSVLERTSGKISGKNGAADLLKIKRTTLYSKMKQLGISKNVEV